METPLLFLLAVLLFVFFQDWKYRRIHVVLPLAIFLLSLYLIYLKSLSFQNMLLNTAFFLVTLGILVLYMSLKNKQFLNPFKHYFGLGDLLFYVAVTPLFILPNFIVFFILSMVFALVLQFAFKKVLTEQTVPLAGFSALFLCIVMIRDYCSFYPKLTLI
ncbi:prepilin peptidase [Flavobacterium cupreum]|uniref:prepilin peptidase n=1 Tax=Flavobacterium cupreum TaxID=2133766 RepID=UPI00137648BC|nr:prepilin peptidase [Flavobacterium cupreum]